MGEVISRFEAYGVIREHGEQLGYKKLRNNKESLSGKPLVMRLMKNDIVQMEIEGKKYLMRVVKIAATGRMAFVPINEANVDARNRDPKDTFSYLDKNPGSLSKTGCRRVSVSSIGRARVF